MTRQSPTAALIPPLVLGLAYLLVFVPLDAFLLARFGSIPAWPIRLLAYAAVVASLVLCWRLAGMKVWALRRRVEPWSYLGFTSWCGGSCSLALPGFEVGLHYPPAWARPLRYAAAAAGFATLLGWAVLVAYVARSLA